VRRLVVGAQPSDEVAHCHHLGRRGDVLLAAVQPLAQPGEIENFHGVVSVRCGRVCWKYCTPVQTVRMPATQSTTSLTRPRPGTSGSIITMPSATSWMVVFHLASFVTCTTTFLGPRNSRSPETKISR